MSQYTLLLPYVYLHCLYNDTNPVVVALKQQIDIKQTYRVGTGTKLLNLFEVTFQSDTLNDGHLYSKLTEYYRLYYSSVYHRAIANIYPSLLDYQIAKITGVLDYHKYTRPVLLQMIEAKRKESFDKTYRVSKNRMRR